MRRNRLLNQLLKVELPQPPACGSAPGQFVAYPAAVFGTGWSVQAQWQHTIYRLALEQAEAVLRPSLPERDLLAVWN
jgi:hypothetical protein